MLIWILLCIFENVTKLQMVQERQTISNRFELLSNILSRISSPSTHVFSVEAQLPLFGTCAGSLIFIYTPLR